MTLFCSPRHAMQGDGSKERDRFGGIRGLVRPEDAERGVLGVSHVITTSPFGRCMRRRL